MRSLRLDDLLPNACEIAHHVAVCASFDQHLLQRSAKSPDGPSQGDQLRDGPAVDGDPKMLSCFDSTQDFGGAIA